MSRLAVTATFLVLAATCGGALAQTPATEEVRLLYSAKNLSASELQKFLEKHYEGETSLKFTASPNPTLLSIRASNQAKIDDVLKTLESVDKSRRSIAMQLLIIDVTPPADGKEATAIDSNVLTGSASSALNVARTLIREGKVNRVRKYSLTAVDGQISETTTGELVPRVSGVSRSGLGKTYPMYADKDVGLIFSVVPRITATGEVACELIYSASALADFTAALEVSDTEKLGLQQLTQERTQTSVTIPNGRSVVVTDRDPSVKSPHPASLLVLSATIVDPNAPSVAYTPAAPQSTVAGGAVPLTAGAPRGGFGGFGGAPGAASRTPTLLREYTKDEFQKRIKLTDEQLKKFKTLSDERQKISSDVMQSFRDGIDVDGRNKMMQELRTRSEAIDQKALEILTPEQKEIWKEYQKSPDPVNPFPERGAFSRFGAPSPVTNRSAPPLQRLTEIEAAIRNGDRSSSTYALRGLVYLELEQWDKSIADLKLAIELDPKFVLNYSPLVVLMAIRNDEAGYQAIVDQFVARFSDMSDSFNYVTAFYCTCRLDWLKNPNQLVQLIETSLNAAENSKTAAANSSLTGSTAKAWLMVQRGKFEAARTELESAIQRFPSRNGAFDSDQPIAYSVIAVALLGEGKREEAVATLKKARALMPEKPGAGSGLDIGYLHAKVRLEAAERELRLTVESKPAKSN